MQCQPGQRAEGYSSASLGYRTNEEEKKSSAEHIRKHSLFTGAVDSFQQAHAAPLCLPSSHLPRGAAIPSISALRGSDLSEETDPRGSCRPGMGQDTTAPMQHPSQLPPGEAARQEMRSASSTAYRRCFQKRQAAALHVQAAHPTAIQDLYTEVTATFLETHRLPKAVCFTRIKQSSQGRHWCHALHTAASSSPNSLQLGSSQRSAASV